MIKTKISKWNTYGIIHQYTSRDKNMDDVINRLDGSYNNTGSFNSTVCNTCGHLTETLMFNLYNLKRCKELGKKVMSYENLIEGKEVGVDVYLKILQQDIQTVKMLGKWDVDVEVHITEHYNKKRIQEENIKKLPKVEQEKVRQVQWEKLNKEMEELCNDW